MSHATPGDLCTDDCHHLCPNCELGYSEACVDLFDHPTAGTLACHGTTTIPPITTPQLAAQLRHTADTDAADRLARGLRGDRP